MKVGIRIHLTDAYNEFRDAQAVVVVGCLSSNFTFMWQGVLNLDDCIFNLPSMTCIHPMKLTYL